MKMQFSDAGAETSSAIALLGLAVLAPVLFANQCIHRGPPGAPVRPASGPAPTSRRRRHRCRRRCRQTRDEEHRQPEGEGQVGVGVGGGESWWPGSTLHDSARAATPAREGGRASPRCPYRGVHGIARRGGGGGLAASGDGASEERRGGGGGASYSEEGGASERLQASKRGGGKGRGGGAQATGGGHLLAALRWRRTRRASLLPGRGPA